MLTPKMGEMIQLFFNRLVKQNHQLGNQRGKSIFPSLKRFSAGWKPGHGTAEEEKKKREPVAAVEEGGFFQNFHQLTGGFKYVPS